MNTSQRKPTEMPREVTEKDALSYLLRFSDDQEFIDFLRYSAERLDKGEPVPVIWRDFHLKDSGKSE